ncbi:MAG: response regulator transcription factor [Patescibacteria group bacterium]|nr:response regulator transcription factor [Patescibacteria group bacterium]
MGLCQDYASVFPPSAQDTAQAVCECESGGNASAHCLNCAGVPEDSRGLWQINLNAHPDWANQNLYDPAVNAQAALAISNGGTNFNPWTTYTNGCYRQYLTGAAPASSPVSTVRNALSGGGLFGPLLGLGLLLFLGAGVADAVNPDEPNPKGVYFRPVKVSARERELLHHCSHGLTEREIADQMGLSPRTVYGYKQNVYSKLGVHSAPAAVYAARRQGVI